MANATLRFYEELNEFLTADRRKRESILSFVAPVPVRHLIETLGVPHTEVEVILINGESVGLEHPVTDGDRVSVYPMFEALDVTPLLRLRQRPLRDPRFLADAHLGRLAGYLRMLGFDTRLGRGETDRQLVDQSVAQARIMLTRDRSLLMHRALTHGCYIRQRRPREQLGALLRRLDLCRQIRPFSRCIRCNELLDPVPREALVASIPEGVMARHNDFLRCPGCDRVFWKGTHYRRMQQLIHRLCGDD